MIIKSKATRPEAPTRITVAAICTFPISPVAWVLVDAGTAAVISVSLLSK